MNQLPAQPHTDPAGGCAVPHPHLRRADRSSAWWRCCRCASSARARHDAAWMPERSFRKLLATVVVHGAGVLVSAGPLGEGFATVLFALILVFCAARVHHAVAHAARRPPQPGAGLLCGAAAAVLAGGHRALRPVHRVHPGVCVSGDAGGQRAGRRPRALPGAQRQAAVGHHGVHLRHEPCAGAAAAGLSATTRARTPSSCSSWCWWCRPAWWCSTWSPESSSARPARPTSASSFNWRSWLIGVGVASLLGGLLSFITPFKPGQALAMAFVACVAGSLGHLVMKALKRDRGVTSWGKGACRSPAPMACWTGWTRCALPRRCSFIRCAGISNSVRPSCGNSRHRPRPANHRFRRAGRGRAALHLCGQRHHRTGHLPTGDLPARLKVLFDGICEVVQRYQPDAPRWRSCSSTSTRRPRCCWARRAAPA
jgi:uncharacterized membrane protein HdeD (DUF308 family)